MPGSAVGGQEKVRILLITDEMRVLFRVSICTIMLSRVSIDTPPMLLNQLQRPEFPGASGTCTSAPDFQGWQCFRASKP